MKKLGFLVLGIVLSITTATSAGVSGQAIVGFNGSDGGPAGTLYLPVGEKMSVGVGLSVDNRDEDGHEMGYDVRLGLRAQTDFFGDLELSTMFVRETADGSETEMGSIKLTRYFLYDLAPGISLGLSLDLLEIRADDSAGDGHAGLQLLPSVNPVVAAHIAL